MTPLPQSSLTKTQTMKEILTKQDGDSERLVKGDEAMLMNRAARRKLGRANGVKIFGKNRPMYSTKREAKRKKIFGHAYIPHSEPHALTTFTGKKI